MNKLAVAVAAAAASALSLSAQATHFNAKLTGYQEVPAVNTVAQGTFKAKVNTQGSATTVDFELSYEGLQGVVTQAHIHFAQRSVNGPVVVWLCGTATNTGPAGTLTCPQSGTVSGTFSAANVLASPPAQQLQAGAIDDLVDAMRAGAAYVNVHTSLSGTGEIRGQVKP